MTVAETRVAVLLALMRQLQEVMRAENGLLRDLKLARLRELQIEKATLAGHYELDDHQYDAVARAINERLVEIGLTPMIPHAGEI